MGCCLAWTSPVGVGGKESARFPTPFSESGDDFKFLHEDAEAQANGLRPHEESGGMNVGWVWDPRAQHTISASLDPIVHSLNHPLVSV